MHGRQYTNPSLPKSADLRSTLVLGCWWRRWVGSCTCKKKSFSRSSQSPSSYHPSSSTTSSESSSTPLLLTHHFVTYRRCYLLLNIHQCWCLTWLRKPPGIWSGRQNWPKCCVPVMKRWVTWFFLFFFQKKKKEKKKREKKPSLILWRSVSR